MFAAKKKKKDKKKGQSVYVYVCIWVCGRSRLIFRCGAMLVCSRAD